MGARSSGTVQGAFLPGRVSFGQEVSRQPCVWALHRDNGLARNRSGARLDAESGCGSRVANRHRDGPLGPRHPNARHWPATPSQLRHLRRRIPPPPPLEHAPFSRPCPDQNGCKACSSPSSNRSSGSGNRCDHFALVRHGDAASGPSLSFSSTFATTFPRCGQLFCTREELAAYRLE